MMSSIKYSFLYSHNISPLNLAFLVAAGFSLRGWHGTNPNTQAKACGYRPSN
jgi:hypothetical protein